jgi:hypothetical protein
VTEPIPPILFKYFGPERLDVLTGGTLRVSQRQAVNDPDDFRPPFANVAPDDVLARALETQVAGDPEVPVSLRPALVQHLVANYRDEMLQITLAHIKTPDQIGMVCLTDNPDNNAMWRDYAARSTGFLIGFDVRALAGTFLPRLFVRQVRYTDTPIRYLNEGVSGLNAFYQKSTGWSHESEWRGTGVLAKFPVVGNDGNGLPIHLCSFPGNAVRTIIVRPQCVVADELHTLIAIDARYRHVTLQTQHGG